MIPYRPDSRSEILRAARILCVRIDSALADLFHPVAPNLQERKVALALTLLAVSKGEVAEAPGDKISIRVTQAENLGSRFTAVPGVWSRIDLSPGSEFVAFTGPDGASAAEALADPVCFRLAPADPAAGDVADVDMAGCPELRLAGLLDRLCGSEARFGPFFARYLADRLPDAFPDRRADLDAVLRVLEAPALGTSSRFVLCDGAVGNFILWSPLSRELMPPFVLSLFRLLLLPEAADLHENLTSTWIPNLVGIEGGMERLVADDVFAGDPLRAQAAGALAQANLPGAGPLLAWVQS
ncbi:hypothetical protein WMF45_23170 [Sorangium sp. So ce448]|uniref:hypothetical protein n=1 Tax=Sorangium sp. So ce448 TaxID=3133314 RepID=UPI003F5F021C